MRLAVVTLVAFATLVPSAAAATTVEGRLEILHMDMAGGQAREIPQLVVGSRRYELVGAEARRVAPGSTVRVTGSVRGERIEAEAVQLVAPAAAAPAGVTTSVLAVLVHSSGPDDVTPEIVEDQLEGADSQWFRDVSKGQIAGLTVDATEWLAVPERPCSGLFGGVEAAATAAGYDLAAYDRLMFYFPYDADCGFDGAALIGGNQTAINGRENLERGVTLHELGHNYGLHHANQLRCRDAGVFVAFPIGDCSQIEYGDQHDVMGSSIYHYEDGKGHYGAYHLDQLGWLDGRVIDAPSTGGRFDIAPIEQVRLGLQVVRLNDGDRTYWLYFRQPIGVDAFLAQEPRATDGVSVQIKGSGDYGGSAQLDMTPDDNFGDVTLKSGLTWTTPNGAFRIQVTSVSGKSAGIRIKPAGECRALGWQALMTTDGDVFVSEGACKAYVTRGGILYPFTGCLIVNTRSDATFTSGLQSAQNAAQAGDTLTVKGTCDGAALDKDLTITGGAATGYSAPTLGRLQNTNKATVTVNALTITGGNAYYGGGIRNEAVMTLNDVDVRGNSGELGGGINNYRDDLGSGGTLTLNRSTVTGNSAQPTDATDPDGGHGGGIFNSGDVTLNDSTVSGNTAGRAGGGVFNVDPPYGDEPPTTLTLTGTSTTTGNTPDDVVWGPFSFTGCIIVNTRSDATFTSGLQDAQDAALAGDTLTVKGTCDGAALHKDLTITGGAATKGYSAPTLGRLQNTNKATVTVNALTITGGNAYYGGGIWNTADMTLNDVDVRGNSGEVGGGINNYRDDLGSGGRLTLNRSTVTGNSAPTDATDPDAGHGGGIFNSGDVTLNDSTVSGNTAGRAGGGVFNVDPPYGDEPPTTLTLTGTSTITGNTPDDVVWGPFW